MLTIWGRLSSLNVQKVMWLVDELGLTYEHIPAGGAFGKVNEPDFLAMNPHGRVPVIDDGGMIVWESNAILRYLAARYGAGRFWSTDPATQAGVDQWLEWTQTALQPAFIRLFWSYYRTPEDQRNARVVASATAECDRQYRILDQRLSASPFVAGDALSLADIPAAVSYYRYRLLDVDRPETPRLEIWYQGMTQRPAYAGRVMVPFDDLKGRLTF